MVIPMSEFLPPNIGEMVAPAVLSESRIPKPPIYIPETFPKVEHKGPEFGEDISSFILKLRKEIAWS